MARRSRKSEVGVSLFPFLCILICSIGVIISIVVGICLLSFSNPNIIVDISTGNGGQKGAIFVECHSDSLVLHLDEKTTIPAAFIEERYSGYYKLVNSLRSQHKKFIFFLILPHGIETFRLAKSLAVEKNIRYGFEPWDKTWNLTIK